MEHVTWSGALLLPELKALWLLTFVLQQGKGVEPGPPHSLDSATWFQHPGPAEAGTSIMVTLPMVAGDRLVTLPMDLDDLDNCLANNQCSLSKSIYSM
jgi:hypothetical protein